MHDEAVEKKVRRRYDDRADYYQHLYEGHDWHAHYLKTRLEHVRALRPHLQGTRVLEVGCGPAMLAAELVEHGCTYYGVDLSEGMIQRCRERLGHLAEVHFSVGTVRQLDVADAAFDVVLCLGVLEYVRDEQAAVREMARVLDRGGWLILSGNNKWSPRNLWNRLVYRRFIRPQRQTIVKPYHAVSEYEQRLRTVGCVVRKVRYFDYSLLPTPLPERYPDVARSISRRFECLSDSMLRWMGNGFVLAATKRT